MHSYLLNLQKNKLLKDLTSCNSERCNLYRNIRNTVGINFQKNVIDNIEAEIYNLHNFYYIYIFTMFIRNILNDLLLKKINH